MLTTAPLLYTDDAPQTRATAPYIRMTAPYRRTTAPYTGMTAPYTRTTAPYTRTTAQYNITFCFFAHQPKKFSFFTKVNITNIDYKYTFLCNTNFLLPLNDK